MKPLLIVLLCVTVAGCATSKRRAGRFATQIATAHDPALKTGQAVAVFEHRLDELGAQRDASTNRGNASPRF